MSNATKIAIAAAGVLIAPIVFLSAAVGGVASLLSATGGGPGGYCIPTGVTVVGGTGYGPEQITNAATIIAVGKRLNVPKRGWVIALAAALQESGLRNLAYGDRDSLGILQQRPTQGWGRPSQILNPTYAATQFYQRLLAVPGWQQMSITDAAQTVQRSAFPDAYARHEHTARQLVGTLSGAACTPAPAGTWTRPVSGRCTSGYGPRDGQFHRGQDIAAPIGTPIVAASGGRVTDAGPANGYGLWIRIQHANGVVTTYGHNDRNLVHPGQVVHRGQHIAKVGNRGESTGPHLHFQIDVNGHAVDPSIFYQQQTAPPLCAAF